MPNRRAFQEHGSIPQAKPLAREGVSELGVLASIPDDQARDASVQFSFQRKIPAEQASAVVDEGEVHCCIVSCLSVVGLS